MPIEETIGAREHVVTVIKRAPDRAKPARTIVGWRCWTIALDTDGLPLIDENNEPVIQVWNSRDHTWAQVPDTVLHLDKFFKWNHDQPGVYTENQSGCDLYAPTDKLIDKGLARRGYYMSDQLWTWFNNNILHQRTKDKILTFKH